MYKLHWSFKRRWNNKKIALVSILISTSVAFVVVFTKFLPIATIPSFKIAIAGLPIKISGYIFGPVIGVITGVISDLLTFLIYPTMFHYWYTIAFAFAGFTPGVFGYWMHKRWKYDSNKNPSDEYKYNNWNFFITIIVILITMAIITAFVFSPLANFKESLISNRWGFFGIVISGSVMMLVATIIFRFILKPNIFNALLPIIAFSAILDIINTPLVSLGDQATIAEDNFLVALTGHTLLTPMKSWGNMIIIYFSYKIVSPLIFNKTSNSWQTQEIPLHRLKKQREQNIEKGKK